MEEETPKIGYSNRDEYWAKWSDGKSGQEIGKQLAKLEHEKEHDSLTGLFNRRGIENRLEGECARAKRNRVDFSVLFLDLNGLKIANDTFGHRKGDELLVNTADALKTRAVDLVGRWGGDEFLVILPNTNEEMAAFPLAKIQKELESRGVSASIGIVQWSHENPIEAISLIEQAEEQMKIAKNEDLLPGERSKGIGVISIETHGEK